MRAILPILLTSALSTTQIASIPRDPPSTRIEIPYSIPSPMLPDRETHRTVLRSLEMALDTVEYQLRTSIVPVLDYGAQYPEKTKPGLYCRDDHCTFSITFQGVNKLVPDLEDYDDAFQSYRLLERQAIRLGIIDFICPPGHPKPDCSALNLPLLTLIDQDAVLTFNAPYDCVRPLSFLSYPFGKQEIHVVFPTCKSLEKETIAGYEVVGFHVNGLRNVPRPEGIALSYTFTPKNDP